MHEILGVVWAISNNYTCSASKRSLSVISHDFIPIVELPSSHDSLPLIVIYLLGKIIAEHKFVVKYDIAVVIPT